MIIVIIYCLFNIIIAFFLVKIIPGKMRILTKTAIVFPLFIVSHGSLLLAIIINGFMYGGQKFEDKRMQNEGVQQRNKLMYFKNERNQTVSIIVNFEYSQKELLKYAFVDPNQDKIDTIKNLEKGKTIKFITPILTTNPLISFPEKFNIRIIDSTGKIIKTYDKQNFLKNVEDPEYKNIKDEEIKAMDWTLKIKQNYHRRKFK